MHHTDYSEKLRNAHRRTLKTAPHTTTQHESVENGSKDLLCAAAAAILVLFCLFQMDPANANNESEMQTQSTNQ